MKKIICLLILTNVAFTQTKNPEDILKKVKNKFEQIKDYQADVVVKLNMEAVKVPDTKAKVFFKQPNKYKVESDGFAMLPKQSMNFSPVQLLQGDYTSVYVRTEKIENNIFDVIKIIPNNDTTDIILSTMWINSSKYVIHKVETTTKRGGTVEIDFNYDEKYLPLPIELKFSFNMGEIKTNNNLTKKENQQQRVPVSMRVKGSVLMQYSNYKINVGLSDKIFEENKNIPKTK
ncbi:MAG: hypothetical protein N2321_03725 [Melioribacteraceae bacterium]|nr:hypothetical protein [Melioribacteraceae bacterium]